MSNIFMQALHTLGIGGPGCISGVSQNKDGASILGKRKIEHLPERITSNLKAEVLVLGNLYSAAMAVKYLATGIMGLFATVFTGSYAYKKSETVRTWTHNITLVIPDVFQSIPLAGNWYAAWRNNSNTKEAATQEEKDVARIINGMPLEEIVRDLLIIADGYKNEGEAEKGQLIEKLMLDKLANADLKEIQLKDLGTLASFLYRLSQKNNRYNSLYEKITNAAEQGKAAQGKQIQKLMQDSLNQYKEKFAVLKQNLEAAVKNYNVYSETFNLNCLHQSEYLEWNKKQDIFYQALYDASRAFVKNLSDADFEDLSSRCTLSGYCNGLTPNKFLPIHRGIVLGEAIERIRKKENLNTNDPNPEEHELYPAETGTYLQNDTDFEDTDGTALYEEQFNKNFIKINNVIQAYNNHLDNRPVSEDTDTDMNDWLDQLRILKQDYYAATIQFVRELSDDDFIDLGNRCTSDGFCIGLTPNKFHPINREIVKNESFFRVKMCLNLRNSDGIPPSHIMYPISPGKYLNADDDEIPFEEQDPSSVQETATTDSIISLNQTIHEVFPETTTKLKYEEELLRIRKSYYDGTTAFLDHELTPKVDLVSWEKRKDEILGESLKNLKNFLKHLSNEDLQKLGSRCYSDGGEGTCNGLSKERLIPISRYWVLKEAEERIKKNLDVEEQLPKQHPLYPVSPGKYRNEKGEEISFV